MPVGALPPRAEMRRLAERLRLATAQAEALKAEIVGLAGSRYMPPTELKGVAPLTAGTLAGILGARAYVGTEAQAASPQPWRQPPTECRPAPHRPRPGELVPTGTRLSGPTPAGRDELGGRP